MSGLRPSWSRPGLGLAGLLVAYFAFPVRWDSPAAVALSLVLTAAGLGLVGRVMVLEMLRLRSGAPGRTTGALTLLLVLLVMSFSLMFYLLDLIAPDQVTGLHTRTDALYFTLCTMTTVGYGDVHAEGQLARGLVCALIVFNVVVVATLLRDRTRPTRPDE